MPKGSTPSATMLAKYNRMVAENNRAFAKRHKVQRKIIELLKGEEAAQDYMESERIKQRAVSQEEYNRTKKMNKFEKSLLKRGNK